MDRVITHAIKGDMGPLSISRRGDTCREDVPGVTTWCGKKLSEVDCAIYPSAFVNCEKCLKKMRFTQ